MALPTVFKDIFKVRNRSYKMVLILTMLKNLDLEDGSASLDRVETDFQHFFIDREQARFPVDPAPGGVDKWLDVDAHVLRRTIDTPINALKSIIEKVQSGTLRKIRFKSEVWEQLDSDDLDELKMYAQIESDHFFNTLPPTFSLKSSLLYVMNTYVEAKKEKKLGHPLGTLFRQTIPSELNTLSFILNKFQIKGSIGTSDRWVEMPWIAIMDKRVTTSARGGFYVCYIFDKDMESVYLTLKHSDEPLQNRVLPKEDRVRLMEESIQSIRDRLDLPSFIKEDLVDYTKTVDLSNYFTGVIAYKKYDKNTMPSNVELIEDLQAVVESYTDLIEDLSSSMEEPVEMFAIPDEKVKDNLDHIKNYISSRGFSYPNHLIENFYLSLKSKPFVILAGISGTGKTKLVKLFAEALGATRQNKQFTLIPVRPDWSDPSDLLGYKNLQGEFCPGPLVEVLYEANQPENRSKPYFICLDEMNLARVEHYFSDLLSLMETQEWDLCDESEKRIVTGSVLSDSVLGNTEDSEKYKGLHIPENVYLIGTVNMDETTHPFSKKVLDRANTIEFNYIDLDNIEELDSEEEDRPEPIQVHQSFLRSDYLTLQDAMEYKNVIIDATAKLKTVNAILEQIHAHVGFRIRDAVCFYMIYNQRFEILSESQAFDIQFCQKILPRIQGSSSSIRIALIQLLEFAVREDHSFGIGKFKENDLYEKSSELGKLYRGTTSDYFKEANAVYPESAKKIVYMLRRLEEDGFTSFWLS